MHQRTRLSFRLSADETGWPPVDSETLPVEPVGETYRILCAPLFVKGISAGDEVFCEFDSEGYVKNWMYASRSTRSTIWIMPRDAKNWPEMKHKLLELGCNVETLGQIGICSIDLPDDVQLKTFDKLIEPLTAAGAFVVFPSLRHSDEK